MGIKIVSSGRYFIDSNIFIYALENEEQLGNKARKLFSEIKSKSPTVFTSVITITEVLPKVYEEENKETTYLEFIAGNGSITVIEISGEIALNAAKIRGLYNIKTPDAIQIAAALSSGCNWFITADRRLPKNIRNLKVISL